MKRTTRCKASKRVKQLLRLVLKTHHKELARLKVRVEVIMVRGVRRDLFRKQADAMHYPACGCLQAYGAPCVATIKVNGETQRLARKSDAVLRLDADAFEQAGAVGRRALLDQQLCRVKALRNRDGSIKRRPDGSVRFGTRRFDWVLTGFYHVAARYEGESHEVQQLDQSCRWLNRWFTGRGTRAGPGLEYGRREARPYARSGAKQVMPVQA